MKTLSFDPIRADVAITEKEKSAALHANALLHNGQGAGNDFLGWVGLPSALDEEELQAIETEAFGISTTPFFLNIPIPDLVLKSYSYFYAIPVQVLDIC